MRGRPSPYACAVGHAAGFAVNAALVSSQWRHLVWTVTLHTHISTLRTRLDRSKVPFF